MTNIIRKYNSVFLLSAIFYLNFYFLSPFIHEHPLKIWGKTENVSTLHSHLTSILILNSNELNNVDDIYPTTSHTHHYVFNTPIINQCSHNFKIILAHINVNLQDKFIDVVENNNDRVNFNRYFYNSLWERFIHFAADSSPPLSV